MYRLELTTKDNLISIAAVLVAAIPGFISGYFIWKKYKSVLFSMVGFFATVIFICLFYIFIFLFTHK